MSILIKRFDPQLAEKGIELRIDKKNVVIIKDHTTDKIIGMISLADDPNKNLELAGQIIETIENWVINNED